MLKTSMSVSTNLINSIPINTILNEHLIRAAQRTVSTEIKFITKFIFDLFVNSDNRKQVYLAVYFLLISSAVLYMLRPSALDCL